jgi:hypothetical protein
MAFRDTVKAYAQERTVDVVRKYSGGMLSSQEEIIWRLPEGEIKWTGGAWGVRATLFVHTAELRVVILRRLGVDLSRSKICAKFARPLQA